MIAVPSGADLTAYVSRLAPGDILSLAAGATYTLGAGVNGFEALPSGTATQRTTIRGNGATVTGGANGISLTTKQYIAVENLTLLDQTQTGVQITAVDDISFTNVSARSTADANYIDTWKIRNCDRVEITGGVTGPSTGVTSCDGVEFWGPCADCTVTNHIAHGLNNGETTNDGHGFEVYGESALEICDNIQFINCEAYDCRVGFSCEGGASSNALHTDVVCNGCSSHDNVEYGYSGIQGATLYRSNVASGDNTNNGTAETNGTVTDI